MATIEQVRERQQQIRDGFNTQPIPVYRGQITESAKQAVVSAIQATTGPKRKRRKLGALPPPSRAVREFLVHAVGDEKFRHLMERLANE